MSTSRWGCYKCAVYLPFLSPNCNELLLLLLLLLRCAVLCPINNLWQFYGAAQLSTVPMGQEGMQQSVALSPVSWGLSTWHYNECPAQFGQLAKQLPIGQLSQFMRIQSALTVAMFVCSALRLQQQKHVQKQKLQIAKHCKSYVI